MIDLIFQKGIKLSAIRINGSDLLFAEMKGMARYYTNLEGLKLDPNGIAKHYPDLADLPYPIMQKRALERFRKKIKEMKNEDEVKDYLISDLAEHGYKIRKIMKQGFRGINVNG